jgi:hypothetical protein
VGAVRPLEDEDGGLVSVAMKRAYFRRDRASNVRWIGRSAGDVNQAALPHIFSIEVRAGLALGLLDPPKMKCFALHRLTKCALISAAL